MRLCALFFLYLVCPRPARRLFRLKCLFGKAAVPPRGAASHRLGAVAQKASFLSRTMATDAGAGSTQQSFRQLRSRGMSTPEDRSSTGSGSSRSPPCGPSKSKRAAGAKSEADPQSPSKAPRHLAKREEDHPPRAGRRPTKDNLRGPLDAEGPPKRRRTHIVSESASSEAEADYEVVSKADSVGSAPSVAAVSAPAADKSFSKEDKEALQGSGAPWRDLGIGPEELRPSACLTTGEALATAAGAASAASAEEGQQQDGCLCTEFRRPNVLLLCRRRGYVGGPCRPPCVSGQRNEHQNALQVTLAQSRHLPASHPIHRSFLSLLCSKRRNSCQPPRSATRSRAPPRVFVDLLP